MLKRKNSFSVSLLCYLPSNFTHILLQRIPSLSHSQRLSPSGYCVKVTPKKGKATNLKATITVKNQAIRVSGASVVGVGDTVTLKTATAPKGAAVTFKSSDETIATVDEKGVVTGVKAGKVTITATAGKVSKNVEIEVKNYVLTDVAQTKLAELTATVTGSTKNLKTTDFAVKNATTNVVYPVSKVTVDAKDATKVTLTLFSELKDAADYDVTLDGVTKSFKASDGKVAAIALDTATVPYATETEIKLVSKDANGVVIAELPYNTFDASYDFTIDAKGNGYTNGSKLYLNKVGDTAEATITYKSGKYDQNGKAEGNIGPNKVTITAVEQAAVNNFAVRIDAASKTFAKAKDTNKIAVGETQTAYFCIKNADGKEITDYSAYTVESSDKTVLMIDNASIAGKSTKITAVKAGTAYILFKDKDGKVVNSVAVDVVAEKAVATLELDKYSVVVSNDTALDQSKDVKVKLKDQYGNDWAGAYDITATFLSSSNGKKDTDVTALVTADKTNKKVVVAGKDIPAGNYVYKVAYNKDGKEVVAKTLTISVQTPGTDVNSYRLDLSETSVDVKVDENNNKAGKNITAILMGLANGTDKAKTADVSYTVKKADGTVVYGGNKSVTGAAFTVDGNAVDTYATGTTLNIALVSVSGSGKATKNLAAGTYYVTAEKTIASKKVSITSSFTVTDTQTKASASVKENLVTATTVQGALEAALSVSYGDDVYCNRTDKPDGAKQLTIVKAEGQLNNGTKITDASSVTAGQYFTVTKLVVNVAVATGVTMDVEVSVPGTITIK